MNKLKILLTLLFLGFMGQHIFSQKAIIREENLNMKTYMFGDPDPVANINRIYPYFRFDSYTEKPEAMNWKMVVLENDYIKVYVCPDIGGKIWGAIEKSTGKEFMYFNQVVKFRDVAMRGAWTSGGLEYNFGDIGHIPTCATPVDYRLKEYPDGSVSCVVGALDLPSRTKWNVEIKLGPDKAFFETTATWSNTREVPVTYYHWMNAAAKADGDLEFIYPGNKRIGHGGELGEWPIDENRPISNYKNNDFGIYKSYHIIDSYADFFGGYWHNDDFGFGHYSSYEDKPGKKVWIWGLSDQGMIWEDLLTDADGQYIEYQAGKLFNQAANSSTFTPFKHREFMPYDIDVSKEFWFPLKGTKGMVAASDQAVLNVIRKGNKVELKLSALQPLDTYLVIRTDKNQRIERKITLATLELFEEAFEIDEVQNFEVVLGNKLLNYNSEESLLLLERPYKSEPNFNWESAYGLYVKGLELEKQRRYTEALEIYMKSFNSESTFVPTLNRLALSYYRKEEWSKALEFSKKALSVDTYDGLANYIYGLVNKALNKINDAKSGFSIAAQSINMRTASYTELAVLYWNEEKDGKALEFIRKSLAFNTDNVSALELKTLIYRKKGNVMGAKDILSTIYGLDATNLFYVFENYFSGELSKQEVKDKINNELPAESYLEIALKYKSYGHQEEALEILRLSPQHPIVALHIASLDKTDKNKLLDKALAMNAEMVFPHRLETGMVLKEFLTYNNHWKLKYYLALQQWGKGNIEEARKLFMQCGSDPEFVPFYLAKLKLFSEDVKTKLSSLKRVRHLDKDNWRVQLAWIEYYIETKQFKAAKKITKQALIRYPEKAVLGMYYSKILLELKEFQHSLNFLENFNVLPFEGATEGRTMYHETCIRLSLNAFNSQEYDQAIHYAEKAKLWPKNLGVGKHYDVDERLDNYLLALAYENKGEPDIAKDYYELIIAHKTPEYLNESSKLYLQLMVLDRFSKDVPLQDLLEKNLEAVNSNKYVEWAITRYKDADHEALKNAIISSKEKVHAYDTKFVDEEFKLVSDVIGAFSNIENDEK
ncbi:DUF5107 domain-containing protein [Cellulophaga sp. F20128]|uniref:DUF5107 domain-containing protein n=1 Tax=Cellulophaga sp. F20128 TaxID=2926413 RepID=UPI001FF26FC4|nr:DUF5107 domain-containing protein [Cellulophaga sp. F20128]MCK0158276.1 DUF5107 domain-containing protein [Cellulophaga sp. F20128]